MMIKIVKTSLDGYLFSCLKPEPNAVHGHFYRITPIFCQEAIHVERISILFQVEKDYITGRGRRKDRVRVRELLCYWTVVELRMSMVDLARKFDPNVVKVENATDPRRPRVTL